jgi:hypothetical protein
MSRFNFCDCPAGFNADPERHAPDCPGRSGAGKRGPTPVPTTVETARFEPSVQRFWAEEARNIRCVRAEDFDAHVTRLQAENAALLQRLTIADQRVDDLQHQQSQSLEVNPHSLRVVLTALVGAPHEIRELQACRGLPDNPIDQLLREYNAWIETPTSATPQ